MDNLINILLQRNDSSEDWGFYLVTDADNQIVIDRVKSGSLCSFYMSPGDAVLQVAGRSSKAMTVEKAYHLIKQAGNAVEIIIKKRPQGSSWSPITPATPTFSPSKFTPGAQQSTWKPFQVPSNESSEVEVIRGSVKADPSGGYVHTFGTPKKESSPQTVSSNSANSSFHHNQIPSRQESVVGTPSTRFVQEIVIPTGNQTSQQFRSPARQTSFQNNSSQFSPVYQSPQVQSSATPIYYQNQNNGYSNRQNGALPRQVSNAYQTNRQDSLSYQDSPSISVGSRSPVSNQTNSWPNSVARQDSIPYQQPSRQDFTSYQQPYRQDSVSYQQPSRQDSMSYQQPSRQDSMGSYQQLPRQDSMSCQQPLRQDSTPYQQPLRQDSTPYQQLSRQDSTHYQQPSRQESWNQPSQQATSPYSPSRQNTFPNQPVPVMYRQESLSNTHPHSPNRQDSFNSPPAQVSAVTYQPSSQSSVGGLFSHQNSASPTASEQAVRYEPVAQSSAPGFQRQSSIQYQPSPKPYSPNSYSPGHSPQPNFSASPQVTSVPGPFTRQQSSSGSQPWSSGPVESFPTPPPFSPTSENAGAPWPSSSELPTPPPPPPPSQIQQVPPPPPLAAPPPPPPPPPPPSSAGVNQEIPAWKRQIQATKEAKAAAGISSQTPGTPSGAPELPAALAGSMKKDKKPFTYLPGGLDLSEIRSPKMQRRIIANQQEAPPPPSCMGQQVLLQPQQQLPNQFDRLNLADEQKGMATAIDSQRPADNQDPRNYGQSRSFRLLQMMTGDDEATDSVPQQPAGPGKRTEEEMRFTGLRRPDNPIPSRAFQTLQKMTPGCDEPVNRTPADSRYKDDTQDQAQEDGPVDIRYKGGYIPGRSFKMLQEMTGMNEDGTPTGTVVPSVLQEKKQQRKPPAHLHLAINQPQPPPPKQFPQPSVPASQQTLEEVPKMYTGAKIPSRSFRMLQAMTGENANSQGEDGTDM